MIEWDQWLDSIYYKAVESVGDAAVSMGISPESWTYWLGGKALNMGVVGQAKAQPQTRVSKGISHAVGKQVDEKLAQHLQVYDPVGLGFITKWRDTFENIRQGNWQPFVHGGIHKGVGFLEGKMSEIALLSLASVVVPSAIAGALPGGIVASACYIVLGKTMIDSMKRSAMGGTVGDHYKASYNFLGLEGVTEQELKAFPQIKELIETSNSNMLNYCEKLTEIYRNINGTIEKLQAENLTDKEYGTIRREYGKYMNQYMRIVKDYKEDIDETLAGYESLARMQKAGFASKKMATAIQTFARSMKDDMVMLEENVQAFNEAFQNSPAKLKFESEQQERTERSRQAEREMEEQSALEMAQFYQDMKLSRQGQRGSKEQVLKQRESKPMLASQDKPMTKTQKRRARRKRAKAHAKKDQGPHKPKTY